MPITVCRASMTISAEIDLLALDVGHAVGIFDVRIRLLNFHALRLSKFTYCPLPGRPFQAQYRSLATAHNAGAPALKRLLLDAMLHHLLDGAEHVDV